MKLRLTRTLSGYQPADEDAAGVLKRFPIGTTFEVDVVTRKTRSGAWHRRYWALMNLLAQNLEQVEVEPGMVLPIKDAESVHVAMKYATGLFDSYAIKGGVVRLLRSTAFDRMEPEEWERYWQRVLAATHERFLPSVELHELQDEIGKLAS